MIDSEQVPRGKGEKHPGEGDEIVSETICLQGVGAPIYRGDSVPIEEWANEFVFIASLSPWRTKAQWKRGLIARLAVSTRPETEWSRPDQGEV